MSIPSRHGWNAEEFFELSKDWKPTNIAIDLQMPDMDGVKVMEELRGSAALLKLLFSVASMNACGRSCALCEKLWPQICGRTVQALHTQSFAQFAFHLKQRRGTTC